MSWTVWLGEHPYVLLYVIGCVLVLLLTLFKVVLFGLISWMTNEHIFTKNIKKIVPPDERSVLDKAGALLAVLAFNAALSWISVVYSLWEVARVLLASLRELFISRPEAIKVLRFPLRNNPHMPRESVWAYAQALQVQAGERQPSETELRSSLDELRDNYSSFDRAAALKRLKDLNVLNPEVVSATLDNLSNPAGGDEEF